MTTLIQQGQVATDVFYRVTRGDAWNGPTVIIESETINFAGGTVEAVLKDEPRGIVRYDFAPSVTVDDGLTFTLTIPSADCANLMCGTYTCAVRFKTDTFDWQTVLAVRLRVEPLVT